MENYMLLQSKNVQIPLLAKNGVWKFTLEGVRWELMDSMERLYAYLIIGAGDIGRTAETLRINNRHITPSEIDHFIIWFKQTHPLTNEEFSLAKVPIYATKRGLYLPNCLGYEVWMSAEQESNLLQLLLNNQYSKQEILKSWFMGYVYRYGLVPRYKRDIDTQYEFLALSFCEQHGIDYWQKEIRPVALTTELKRTCKEFKVLCILIIKSSIGMIIGYWLVDLSESFESFMLQTVLFLIGGAMIFGSISWLFKGGRF